MRLAPRRLGRRAVSLADDPPTARAGFAEKAAVAEKLGARALVIVNTDASVVRISADPGLGLTIPTVMAGDAVHDKLEDLAKAPGCATETLLRIAYDQDDA